VQIGNEPLGLSDNVVMGPPGPTCAPASPPPSQRASCSESEASQLTLIQAVNEDRINFGGVYLDHSGVLVIQYVGANAGRAAVEQLIGCAEAVRWVKVERSAADLFRIIDELSSFIDVHRPEFRDVFAVSIDTIGNQVEVSVGPSGSVADLEAFLNPIYGNAVRVQFSSDPPVVH
jgi:hypothetical protein